MLSRILKIQVVIMIFITVTQALAVVKTEISAPQGLNYLSWDTSGGGRETTNLLRRDHLVRVTSGGDAGTSVPLLTTISKDAKQAGWTLSALDTGAQRIILQPGGASALKLTFPFDPRVTPTTFIATAINPDRSLQLPGILSAPDFGLMLLSCDSNSSISATLTGSREAGIVDLNIIAHANGGRPIELKLEPLRLPAPAGIAADDPYWKLASRSWLNVIQPTARWGDPVGRFGAPAGVLGNNVVSDPVSFALWTYADAAFWLHEPAPGINLMLHVRDTLEWWLDAKTSTTGECIGYWDHYHFVDSNPSLLISAWDYVESTHDLEWLERRIAIFEKLSAFLESRDIDHDGLVEATQSGNRGTLHEPHRSSCWWDAINCGNKDGYSNALIYRGWRCLADLEIKLNRTDQAQKYTALADKLKATYFPALYNPATGWLGWWRSADGELHDYASPIVNGLAIEYGLVPADKAKDILSRLRRKAEEAGFERADLGIPSFLSPVHRSDYLLPDGLGIASREDGTDTFGHYMNGGITAGHTLHWLAAHYLNGEDKYADDFLMRMLQHGAFQNGVTNQAPKGIDWTDWNGNPTGYEGFLSDNYRFLQAVVIRNPKLRQRIYRPMMETAK